METVTDADEETGWVPKRADSDPRPPETPRQALERARGHARKAAVEALAALEALVDAASLAAAGVPGERTVAPLHAALAELRRLLEDPAAPGAEGLIEALLGALEAEIARWERRGDEDPEARAVLRAFLGMREILWELGVRAPRHGGAAPRDEASPGDRRKPRKARLQRVRVEG